MSNKLINYIGISRDHSGSMYSLAKAAATDYNETIQLLKESVDDTQDTIVSVVNCGTDRWPTVSIDVLNTPIQRVNKLNSYSANATGTPLFDSVGQLIDIFESIPDINNPDASFLIMAVTDGEENASKNWSNSRLTQKIKELQLTDRWTFVFRVPKGYKTQLIRTGIPEGNIFEWDQTAAGVEQATNITKNAITEYYSGLKSGVKSTTKFFTNLNDVSLSDVKKTLTNISSQIKIWHVDTDAEGSNIRDYCSFKLGTTWKKGAAFYLLVKPEREVQDYKLIIIKNKTTGEFFSGTEARDLLGLPHFGMCKIVPGNHGDYEIFIQSTSINRKLPKGTTLVYWEGFDKL